MTAPLRIGIIGTGGMAHWHARQFLALGNTQIVAVCDIDAERAATFAKTYNAEKFYSDYKEMLAQSQLDAISIVTSNDAHHPISMAAIEAGIHVMCEKPLALTVAQAQEMYDASLKAGVITGVNFTHRNTPCFSLARKIIASGQIGKIYHVQCNYLQDWMLGLARRGSDTVVWRTDKRIAGSGELGDLGAHIIDLLHTVVGDIVAVNALLPNYPELHNEALPREAISDDIAALQLVAANGAVIHATASRVSTGLGNQMTLDIYGHEGAIKTDDLKETEAEACIGSFQVARRAWSTFRISDNERELNPIEIFVNSIRTGQQSDMGFAAGLKVQQVLEAAEQSAVTGQRISLV